MSQLRLNPLNGRWVTIVAERSERPTDFAPRAGDVETGPQRPCPFCPGNEEAAPPALCELRHGDQWQVRVVENRYPAFSGDEHMAVRNLGPIHVQADASGQHEVLVFTPRHNAGFADLDDSEAADTLLVLRDRLAAHAAMPHIRYTQAIVNYGREAGASLAHPHGQLLGMPFVPGDILDEERAFARFEGGCVLCTTAAVEELDGRRVIISNEHVMIVCPYWSGVPFELLVIPRQHVSHLNETPEPDLAGIGLGIRDALLSLSGALGDVSYNLVFHTSPHQHRDGHYHWHAHVWPKLTTIAGFERGTGVMINITAPETAADRINDQHRLDEAG